MDIPMLSMELQLSELNILPLGAIATLQTIHTDSD